MSHLVQAFFVIGFVAVLLIGVWFISLHRLRQREPFSTQEFCPKCHRMYCEGFWGMGVCIVDMAFGSEPTNAGDQVAEYVRQWYEKHRESWWDRHSPNADRSGRHADEFMLSFVG